MGKITTRKVAAPVKSAKAPKEKAIPPQMTALVEKLCKAVAARKAMEAKVTPLKTAEDDLRADVLALFGKKKVDGMKHRLGTLSIYETTYPVVESINKVLAYAKRKGNSDIVTVGLSSAAWRARLEAGKQVPGVSEGKRNDLRVTLAKK